MLKRETALIQSGENLANHCVLHDQLTHRKPKFVKGMCIIDFILLFARRENLFSDGKKLSNDRKVNNSLRTCFLQRLSSFI